MELEVLNANGSTTGSKVKLPKHVFQVKPNEDAVYLAVKVYNANQRQGNASTKSRSFVRGGGRKPGKGVFHAATDSRPVPGET